jgi:hypothetical protein
MSVSPFVMADQPGGRFGFAYPNFTGTAGAMTAEQFVAAFGGAMHNPNVYRQWISAGKDIRKLNPGGTYLKHINLRTIDSTQREPSVEAAIHSDQFHQVYYGMAPIEFFPILGGQSIENGGDIDLLGSGCCAASQRRQIARYLPHPGPMTEAGECVFFE